MMVCFLVAALLASDKPSIGSVMDGKFVIEKKKCPPHQWHWQDIVDQDGVKHGERIVCKVCGPLNFQPGRSDESES